MVCVDLSLSLSIYIYRERDIDIHIHIYICMDYTNVCAYISLSLYIYIYIYILLLFLPVSAALMLEGRPRVRSGPLLSRTLRDIIVINVTIIIMTTIHIRCVFIHVCNMCMSYAFRLMNKTPKTTNRLTPSPPIKSFDFRGFDSSKLFILRGGNSHVC